MAPNNFNSMEGHHPSFRFPFMQSVATKNMGDPIERFSCLYLATGRFDLDPTIKRHCLSLTYEGA